ncbi:long-chain fatty acid--CoA ligase [Frankia sp. AgB1.9]|uniref:class I adenylate-forming enzyme family protein n=1 Tax=unclassified Frankia TaxID=2632575 RepID=UPI001934418C|nr:MULTISPECIES: fatty acid--CoA ligase family protein [unclassified Frankia]MBL7492169.1 long-chain fatty acid--CoA ligase [Frankia sp. AgW1.1]MBL7552109.1 long-chain fatty acid--CoA ligase [Frankia sp. AgB1.9]MBL7622172.1 long-chain fatty acid--CoA ligase [Frankia sp. AgB1.8]
MLADTVRAAARRFGAATAFVDPDGTPLSFAGLDDGSDAVAVGLAARGLGPGGRLVLRLPSTSRYVLAYAAAAKLAAVTAGVNPVLAAPEQDRLTELADPRLVLTDPAEVDELAAAGARLLAAGTATPPAPLPADANRPVAIVFTSGTTGTPKAAVFTERQLRAVTEIDTGGAWADRPGEPALAATQFAHVGFMTKLPWYLRRGLRMLIQGRWRARDTLALLAEHRMTTVNAVAPQLALLLRVPDFDTFDLSAVKLIVAGAAASPPALVEEARRRLRAPYSVRYSSTESGGCGLGTAPDADDDEALFTIGRPRPGIECEIRDDDGRGAPDGEIGELWLRTPSAFAGYWRDPATTAATLVDGWVRTGDLGRRDERGLVRLVGRRKEMFIRGGYNVYPAEVEAALGTHPAVAQCAVIPRLDPVMGEIGVAVVVLRDGAAPPTLADLRAHLAPVLARYKLPEDVRIVASLPLTAVHKLDRAALAAQLAL